MRAIPVSLVAGAAIGLGGSTAAAMAMIASIGGDDTKFDQLIRWFNFNFGCAIAEGLLTAIGLFAVARRSFGLQRTMVSLAAWAAFASLGWYLVQAVVTGVLSHERSSEIVEYAWKVIAVASIGSMVALAVAARVFTRPSWVTAPAVFGVLAAVLGRTTPVIGPMMQEWLGRDELSPLYWLFRDAVLACALLAMVHAILHESPPATPDPSLASTGFRRAAIALVLRIFGAIALAMISLGMVRSEAMVKWVFILGPSLTVVTTLVVAWGLLDVERAALPEMPRVRLVLGAAMLAWTAGIQLQQTVERLQDAGGLDLSRAEQWLIVSPIVAIVGAVLVVSAVYSFAVARGNERLRASAIARGWLFAILALAPTLLQFAMLKARSAGAVIGLGLLAIGCAIASIVVLSGLMNQAADAIGDAPVLPEARLRQ